MGEAGIAILTELSVCLHIVFLEVKHRNMETGRAYTSDYIDGLGSKNGNEFSEWAQKGAIEHPDRPNCQNSSEPVHCRAIGWIFHICL